MPRLSVLKFCLLGAVVLGLPGCESNQMNAGSAAQAIDKDMPDTGAALAAAPAASQNGFAPLEMREGGSMGVFGLNLDEYFSQDLKNDPARIARLEKVVTAMHRDLQVMVPAMQKLNPQPDVTYVVQEKLEVPVSAPVSAPSDPVALKAVAPAEPSQAAVNHVPTPQPVSGAAVTAVRIGEHSDRVRLVFDTTESIAYNVDLDNGENILVVELPGAAWQPPAASDAVGKSGLIKSYKVDPLSGTPGHIFVMQLTKATNVLSKSVLPAASGKGKRIVIDLAK